MRYIKIKKLKLTGVIYYWRECCVRKNRTNEAVDFSGKQFEISEKLLKVSKAVLFEKLKEYRPSLLQTIKQTRSISFMVSSMI